MDSQLPKRTKLLLLLFSLIGHTSILYIILFMQLHDTQSQLMLTIENQEEWAALKPRASHSANIIFQEPEIAQQVQQEVQNQQESPVDEPEIKQTPPLLPPIQESDLQESTISSEDEINQEALKPEKKITQVQSEEPTQVTLREQAQHKITTGQKDQDQHKEQKEHAAPKEYKKNMRTTQVTRVDKKDLSSHAKKLVLADITRGLLDYLKDEGEYSIKMEGNENLKPSLEQLKHERYVEKVAACIQNSFKINRHKFHFKEEIKTAIEVYLELAQSGKMNKIKVIKSTGISALDDFMLFAFYDASSSFPPVPRYLNRDPYKIIFIVDISTVQESNFRFFMR